MWQNPNGAWGGQVPRRNLGAGNTGFYGVGSGGGGAGLAEGSGYEYRFPPGTGKYPLPPGSFGGAISWAVTRTPFADDKRYGISRAGEDSLGLGLSGRENSMVGSKR